MRWGLPWSVESTWGIDEDPNVVNICDLADDRVLIQMDDTAGNRKFRDLICDLVGPLGAYITVLRDIQQAFNLDFAVGEQLDFVGSVLGLKRQNFGDDDYRRFLKIQRDLILGAFRKDANWTGTINNILTICRTFTPTAPSIVLVNFGGYSFELSIPSLSAAEFQVLNDFICKALYAGVLGQVIEVFDAFSLWNSDDVAVTGGGIWCSDDVTIPNCATWAQGTPIGDCPAPA